MTKQGLKQGFHDMAALQYVMLCKGTHTSSKGKNGSSILKSTSVFLNLYVYDSNYVKVEHFDPGKSVGNGKVRNASFSGGGVAHRKSHFGMLLKR